MDLNTYLLHEQNYVEVSCEIIDVSKAAEVLIYCCGVHEYKEDEELKKPNLILCTSPSPCNTTMGCDDYLDNTQFSRESYENQCHYEDNFAIDCCSLPKNLGLHEKSDEEAQQFSASINPEMLEGNGCMAQKKGKTTDIMSADTIHQSMEMSSLHLQLYGDRIWDPMLLECQLNCMNENRLPPNNCHTSENKEVEPKGPPVQEHEAKRDEVAVIPMEHKKCQFDLTLSDDNMEAFYAALHAETYPPPSSSALEDSKDYSKLAYPHPQMSEETKKSLELLKELLSKQICHLVEPTSSTSMKTTLEYLCTLFADDDVSLNLKSLILQLSADFTQWSWDYNDANMKLESSTAGLSRLQKLEEGLVANKNQFSEFVSIENELRSQLVYLKERMKELEEQINAIKVNISISAMASESALKKKRETFETGRVLKAQRDELWKRRLRFRADQESAKATKEYIEDEWSKIREKFDRILNILGLH